jgi:HEPN domain-containing protein
MLKNLINGYTHSANNDLDIIEYLYKDNDNILIFYHIQQAFEKLLKVIYLQTSTSSPEIKVKEILKFRHRIEDITFDLIILRCNEYTIQCKPFENLCSKDYDKSVKQFESYKNTAKTEKQNMRNNFNENIRNYPSFIDKIYENFTTNSTQSQGNSQIRIPLILSVSLLLSSCLYKMNNLSRYPEEDFDCRNLDILKENLYLIPKILEMFEFWFNLIGQPLS